MLEMKMISLIPSGSLDGAMELLSQLKWNISFEKQGDSWLVFGGEKCLLKSSSEETAQAFVYGLALAYGVMPGPVVEQLKREAQDAVGE